jgi:ankyrin repeat protein
VPIYRSTYVLAYRDDAGFTIKDFDDPKLRELRLGTFQHSGIRVVLANHGITENVKIHIISHNADLEPEKQPWRQVQEVLDGKLDVAAVWGPFAGFLKTMQGAPLTIQPVNLMEDKIPLEFDMAIGMPKTSVVLKYMLDNALEKSKDEIKKILTDYGVPLVQCSRCIVSGDIPSHGSFLIQMQEQARKQFTEPLPDKRTQIDKDQATPDQIVTNERLEDWLKDGSNLNQELANAVLASDRGRIAFMLDKGADINKPNPQGLPALHAAARQRDSETVTFLVGKGADVNARDSDGWTPVMHAAFRNHAPSIAALAKAGADLEATAPGGFTPLSIAIEEGKFIAVKALLDAGANVNTPAGNDKLTPLMLIASQPLVERRAASLNQGLSSVDIGRLLIAGGAEVNAATAKGVTPLMIAAAHNNPPLIGLLIQAGADGDAKTPDGKTALDIAKSNQNEAAAQQIELLSRQSKRQGAVTEIPPAEGPESAAGQ